MITSVKSRVTDRSDDPFEVPQFGHEGAAGDAASSALLVI